MLIETPFSPVDPSLKRTVDHPAEYALRMAEMLPKEGIVARLAEIRGQLKLLSDYL
ncbi:MAG TPA: hypothetical protein VFL56_06630 [Solirubrobacterales bacterium]|nr:hypothetical protein [Solirubrobacterales bacterium]